MNEIIEELLESEQLQSVSSGDALPLSSVSGSDAVTYYINLYTLPEPTQEPETMVYTIWDKPLEEYTVTESLLLFLVIIALVVFVWAAIKGGFKWRI